MKTECYLIVTGNVEDYVHKKVVSPGPVSVRRGKPTTGPNEVAIRVSVDIPDELFTGPSLSVDLKVPPTEPVQIDQEMCDTLAQQISDSLGVTAHVTFDLPGEESKGE